MQYVHLFNTESAFTETYFGEGYGEPWLSATIQTNKVHYNKTWYEKMISTPLTFKVLSAGTVDSYISWICVGEEGQGLPKTIQYKKNDGAWTSISSEQSPQIPVVAGDIIQFKGDNSSYAYSENLPEWDWNPQTYNSLVAQEYYYDGEEWVGCTCKVYGNIMSLISSTNFKNLTTLTDNYTFAGLFNSCYGLVDASMLILPATSITPACYSGMFLDCINLETSPETLPANDVPEAAYFAMFQGAKLTTTTPKIQATSVGIHGCTYMFNNAHITEAPDLPATAISKGCYEYMFSYCYSLRRAPEILPVTNLSGATSCYGGMFMECISLINSPKLPATVISESCYEAMFAGCTSLTDIPSVLPATELKDSCYHNMFSGCTSITVAPELPATSIDLTGLSTNSCYQDMFSGCTSLSYVKCMIENTSGSGRSEFMGWLSGVSPTGTFVKNSLATNWPSGVDGIPTGWTVVNA